MSSTGFRGRKYMLAVALGGIMGGFVVTYATKAIPRIMSGMMQNMMTSMREEGCDPAEM